MEYETATDPEINKAVFVAKADPRIKGSDVQLGKVWDYLKQKPDYCNNPSDMWPIILEHRIGLMFNWDVKDIWSAIPPTSSGNFSHENPLRCAAIVYLKMEEAK